MDIVRRLFGAASLQTYLYFSHYPKDAAQFKALVRLFSSSFLFQELTVKSDCLLMVTLFGTWVSGRCSERVSRVLNAFHLALTSHAFYYYSITNYVKPEALVRIEWSVPTMNTLLMLTMEYQESCGTSISTFLASAHPFRC